MANKRVLEALIRSGAFDSTGDPRRGMLEVLPLAMADGERRRKDAANGQGGLFDGMARPRTAAIRSPRCRRSSGTRRRCCATRRRPSASTSRPTRCRACASSCTTRSRSRWPGSTTPATGRCTWTGGIVANAQKRVSKNGGVWLSFRLEDIDGGVECRAWPKVYEQYRELLVEDAIIKVKGRIERRAEGDTMLIAIEVVPFNGVSEYHPLTVVIDSALRARRRVMDDLRRVLSDFPGQVPVVLQMVRGEQRARLRVGDGLRVDPVAGLYAELKALLGESCIGVG